MDVPFFSIVIPVLDGGAAFEAVLRSIASSSFQDFELIVVDDGSTDGSLEAARDHEVSVLTTPGRQGPGAARNLGAQEASGSYLFFLDADCELHVDTLERAAEHLRTDPSLDGLFGSYDDAPVVQSYVSQYRNLLHHFTHQQAEEEVSTFWAGCGALRRSTFEAAGGFDVTRYKRPSIEDIELGLRLHASGARLRLTKDVLVKHHKAWTLGNMLRTDIFARALPWTRLVTERTAEVGTLNLDWRNRLSSALVALLVVALLAGVFSPWALALALFAATALLWINRTFYRLLAGKGSGTLTLVGIPLHWLYFLYSGTAFAFGSILYRLRPAA